MAFYLLRRLALLVLAVFIASVVIFVLLQLLPGDLAQVLGGTQASPTQVAELRRQLGLNRPLTSQYGSWIWKAMHGNFGTSPLNGTSVAGQLADKLTISGPLILASTVLSVIVAVPLGVIAAARHRKADGIALSAVSQLGIALPSFLVGLFLIIVFAVNWRMFPSQGFPLKGWSDPGRAVRSLVLQTFTLALAQGAVLMRFVRSATLDVLHQDYIRTARAKGMTRTQALFRHGLRNASLPIVSILGVQIASLIAGLVVIERTFNLAGVGQMLATDISARDLVKVQGTVLLIAVVVLLLGFLVDVAHLLLDPRLRARA
ncbi:MAG: ABC-type transporter, integral rane subunit [Ilumatobacteraceae bacterium]|nr:ABC-type transporter, integral rane subunit [Ilumatobacteraceae bacterium]